MDHPRNLRLVMIEIFEAIPDDDPDKTEFRNMIVDNVLNKFLNDAKIEHWETATRILCQFYPKNHLLSPALINIFNGNRLGS